MNQDHNDQTGNMDIAEKIRAACIKAAKEGFQDATVSGLCMDGAIEAAIGAIQSLDIEKIHQEQGDNRVK